MTCIWFEILYMYGSVASEQISSSFSSEGDKNYWCVETTCRKRWGGTTSLVFADLPAKIKIWLLNSYNIQLEWVCAF